MPLVDAAKSGNAAAVRAELQKKADVNAAAVDGSTALHWAVHRDALDVVDLLLGAGANPMAANRYGVTPLSLAATNGNARIVERLLRSGGDPNAALPGGETVLMTAARTGDVAVLKALVEANADVNARESTRGQTALMWAAAENNVAAIKVLVAAGADVNARTSEGAAPAARAPSSTGVFSAATGAAAPAAARGPSFTPLLFAVQLGQIDAVRALLEARAQRERHAARRHERARAGGAERTLGARGVPDRPGGGRQRRQAGLRPRCTRSCASAGRTSGSCRRRSAKAA